MAAWAVTLYYKVLKYYPNRLDQQMMYTLKIKQGKLTTLLAGLRKSTGPKIQQDTLSNALKETVAVMRERIHKHGLGANNLPFTNSRSAKGYLVHSGRLMNEFTLLLSTEGVGLGWSDASITERAVILEKRYKQKIWVPSAAEKTALQLRLAKTCASIIQQP